jgi:uncharacterized protein (TIGR03084 family)
MSDAYRQVVADLAAEHDALAGVVHGLSAEDWERPTHAPGWAVRDQLTHLAFFDEAATLAIADPEEFVAHAHRQAGDVAAGGEPAYLVEMRQQPASAVLGRWEAARSGLVEAANGLDPSRRMPWYGPEMAATSFITARLMECWSHGLDIVDVAGTARPPSDRLRHVAFLGVRTRAFSYVTRGLEPNMEPVAVDLVAPSGERWLFGDPSAANRISGPAEDFCQVVTQRRHPADTALVIEGEAAAEWMRYAQAFAGPPGEGRQPGQFPRVHP